MQLRLLWLTGVLLLAAACSPGGAELYVPEGEAEAGREVFAALECHSCHRVLGEDFPAPTAEPPVPVPLGSPMNKKSRQYLAESIIAPSHRFAKPPDLIIGLNILEQEYEDIEEGGVSRMGFFNDALTVREWVDLVAYLDSLQNRSRNEVGQF